MRVTRTLSQVRAPRAPSLDLARRESPQVRVPRPRSQEEARHGELLELAQCTLPQEREAHARGSVE